MTPAAAAPTEQVHAPHPSKDTFATVGAALWFGLAVGLIEVGLILARIRFAQSGLYRQDPHVLWMAPASDIAIFGALGLLLTILARPIPKIGRRLSTFLLCTLALFAILLAIPGLRAGASLALAAGMACWIEPAIRSKAAGTRRFALRTAPILALAMAALVAIAIGRDWRRASAVRAVPPASTGKPNVLLVVLDTVRADATSLQDPSREITPNLVALARRGAQFDRAIATAPWTLASHASMFTGRWAWEVGVGPDQPLDDRYPTLAEYLGRFGYDTAGFAANTSFCTIEYGLARGFRVYEDYAFSPIDLFRSSALGWMISRRLGDALDIAYNALGYEANHPLEGRTFRKDAARINRDALRWIEQPRDRPFFAFLNYFDAHDPYLLPAGAQRRQGRPPATLAERKALRDWISETPRDRPQEQFALAREAYDDCLAYLDEQIGRLIDELERRGILENTVVIVTSDHGEHFGEHHRDGLPQVGHRLSVFQAEVHVPLLIVGPGRVPTGMVVPGAVSLRNLPATIVDLAGLRGGSPFPGHSLLSPPAAMVDDTALSEFNPDVDLPIASRYQVGAPGVMRAIVSGDASLHRYSDGRDELYDLRSDPNELHDLAETNDADALLGQLRETMDELTPTDAR